MARRYWYAYNGTSGGESVLGNYFFSSGISDVCSNGSVLCAIYVPAGGANPSILSTNIRNYIVLAKAAHSFYPISGKPYVYTIAV